ncbi:MAG: PHP domain-containing protein [Archaeoglobales archaeon]|nr:PHP domain-containing protein [Archaeoglobales archaeon]
MIDLHIHSNYSDGKGSIAEIARIAKRKNLKKIAIVDHNSFNERKAKRRQEEIDDASSAFGVKIYSGIECDIEEDGKIYLPDFDFDIVIASIHSNLDGLKYYERIIKCVETYEVHVVAHVFSPIFGFESRIEELDRKLVDAMKNAEVAVEINSLHKCPDVDFLMMCDEAGLYYSIGSDAHEISRVGEVSWSLKKAKRYMKRSRLFV